MMTALDTLKGGAAVLAFLVAGSVGLTTAPAQAAGFSFNFGQGYVHNGVELQFSNGRFENNYCLSSSEIRSQLRANGYRDVSIVRTLKRNLVLAVGRKDTHWYQLVVNACNGNVDQQRVRRSANGSFSFSFTFGNGSYAEGNGNGHGNGNGNGNGQGGGSDHGNGGANHEELVCLVTFFDASQVQAGADSDVESARVLPRSRAQALDRPNDRRGIFDYGTEQQTISTCDYLDNLNN